MKIRLFDPRKTVQRRPYRLSPCERDLVREKIEELLRCNIIRPSCSPCASPILLIKKKNGSDRLCVDYRELNSNTPVATHFTSLDMASGYYQIP